MPTDVELAVQRMNTAAFIQADSSNIALQPVRRIQQPNGGYKEDATGPKRAYQVFRVITLSDRDRPLITVDGKQYTAELMLLGSHDAIVGRRDRWVNNGQEYEILEVQAGHRYETKALAVRRG